MAKVLKTSVKLDTKQAVRSLDALEKKIRNVQRAIDKQASVTNKLNTTTNKLITTNNRAVNSANKVSSSFNKQGKSASMLTTKLHRLANAYLGVMGVSAAIRASDTITSAENRLNNLPGGNAKATQSAMNKMFTSSQNARTDYAGMMSNVSKSITLAGDAFDNNIDNAIRFQEIMAKAYTVGGASAAEQHSSMYQMIQALGSGILQGDELRSVREGAPIAYKEIEKFAQGVYDTDQSLKELASQGKITSEIVVAAMFAAGESIDKMFENTQMTFAQAWTMIKNTALKSFEPVLQMLNKALNSDAGKAIINGIGTSLQVIAGAIQVVFTLIGKVYNFISDNWGWISKILLSLAVIIGVVLVGAMILQLMTGYKLIAMWLYEKAVAIGAAISSAAAWLTVCIPLTIILAILAIIIIVIIWVSDSFVDACGIIVGSLYWLWAAFKNIFIWMGNVAMGLWESIKAIGINIGIAFQNAWGLAKQHFWMFIRDCLQGIKWLEPAINAVAKAFGAEGFTLSGLITDVSSKADGYTPKSYVSVGDAWSKGYDTFDYNNLSDAYSQGYNVGATAGQWVSDKVSGVGDWISDKLNIGLPNETINPTSADDMAKKLGDIGDDTGDIKDSMELTAEDLEYLRRVAEMEWKKEFTTANITVDMSNYNTINGDSDLDGIVTKLTDKLYDELNSVANGVYV